MPGVKLSPTDVHLAGEAMAAAVARIDSTLVVGAPFGCWSATAWTLTDQVAALARAVTATNVLHAASEVVGEVELTIDRADLVAALDALADERDAGDEDGGSYRALAELLRHDEDRR